MKPCGLTPNWLSKELKVDAKAVYDIVRGDRAVTALMALRLAKVLDTSPEFWLRLQMMYDLTAAQKDIGKKVNRELRTYDLIASAKNYAEATDNKSREDILVEAVAA